MPQIMTFTVSQCHFLHRSPLWLISHDDELWSTGEEVLCKVTGERKGQQWRMYEQVIVLRLGERRLKIWCSWWLWAQIQDFQELPSPFLVLSTTRLTMTGIRQMGVITRAKTMTGGGSLSSSVGQSLKNLEWMSTKVFSTRGLGHGIRRQSDISSVQRLRLL